MTTLRAIVVDDEAPARQLLRSLLAAVPRIDVVDEAPDGAAAVALIRRVRPDVVFLDVQMPGMNGFDVVGSLDPADLPLIVFVTAYDQYALRAFEVSACDYLLKPFDAARLRATVERVWARRSDAAAVGAGLRTLLRHVQSAHGEDIVLKVEGRHLFLRAGDIAWLEADGKSVRVHLARSDLAVREALGAIEERLDPARFIRVSRSAIVNRAYIQEAQPWFRGDHVLVLRTGHRITTGNAYREAVRGLLGG